MTECAIFNRPCCTSSGRHSWCAARENAQRASRPLTASEASLVKQASARPPRSLTKTSLRRIARSAVSSTSGAVPPCAYFCRAARCCSSSSKAPVRSSTCSSSSAEARNLSSAMARPKAAPASSTHLLAMSSQSSAPPSTSNASHSSSRASRRRMRKARASTLRWRRARSVLLAPPRPSRNPRSPSRCRASSTRGRELSSTAAAGPAAEAAFASTTTTDALRAGPEESCNKRVTAPCVSGSSSRAKPAWEEQACTRKSANAACASGSPGAL
mmetsp:Transcript_30943/g.86687  ORF Transcript_30943/g.86687 Transcript_30943/m.86687 type:complete len:271 (-) Transcript_30943:702-1514(-)